MSRAFGGSILAVAGVLVLGPMAVGHLVQAGYQDLLGGLLGRAPNAEVLRSDYRRGWFGSDAGLELLVRPAAAFSSRQASMRIRLESRIDQGPWAWFSGGFPPAPGRVHTRVEVTGFPVGLPPLLVTTDLSIDGAGLARVHAPPGEIRLAVDAARIRYAELSARVRLDSHRRSISTWLSLPAIELLDATGPRASLSGLRLTADLTRDGADSYRGTGALDVATGRIVATVATEVAPAATAPSGLQVDGISITAAQQARDGLLDLRLALSASRTRAGRGTYGPSEIRLAAEQVDASAVDDLVEGLRMLGSGRVSEEMRGLVMAGLIASLMPRFAACGARLGIDPMRVQTPHGPATGRLDLRLEPLADSPSRHRWDAAAWLAMLRAEGEVELPEDAALSWLERMPDDGARPVSAPTASAHDARALLEAWIRDGWVSRHGGRLFSAFRLGDGLVTINGKTFPLRGSG